jgi:hypothetical protein
MHLDNLQELHGRFEITTAHGLLDRVNRPAEQRAQTLLRLCPHSPSPRVQFGHKQGVLMAPARDRFSGNFQIFSDFAVRLTHDQQVDRVFLLRRERFVGRYL